VALYSDETCAFVKKLQLIMQLSCTSHYEPVFVEA